jgi:hypothetical protein
MAANKLRECSISPFLLVCLFVVVLLVSGHHHIIALSLETCETTNGPLRARQQVRIEFTPPAFDNRGEARDAPRIDPGRISIGARMYRAEVTDMVQLGTVGVDDRYLRTFYITWTAVPGTHRIVGDRLSYEPICTLVVPVS